MSFVSELVSRLRGDATWDARMKALGASIEAESAREQVLLGRILSEHVRRIESIGSLSDVEFSVFSQWGDDGIIQWLIHRLEVRHRTFVEFGVEDYREANTRFLLINDNWSGLVMDSSPENVEAIERDEISWKYDLKSSCAFVTAENVNQCIQSQGINGEIGILHIDVDGNDYWIWRAIEVVQPIIVIIEYNSLFGPVRPISVPYDPGFNRMEAHFSNLFFGASIAALCHLSAAKGYQFIGCNGAGNNAYFVSKKVDHGLRALSAEQGYVLSKFAESRDEHGALSYMRGDRRTDLIRGLTVVNTVTGQQEPL